MSCCGNWNPRRMALSTPLFRTLLFIVLVSYPTLNVHGANYPALLANSRNRTQSPCFGHGIRPKVHTGCLGLHSEPLHWIVCLATRPPTRMDESGLLLFL